MHLRTGTVKISDNCSHASFVSHRGGQMDRFLGVIFREALDLDIQLAKFAVTNEPVEPTLPRCLLARFLGRKAKEP